MAISRYRNLATLDGSYIETINDVDLSKIKTFTISVNKGERLDVLAFRYLGAAEYWWVIAELNDITWGLNYTTTNQILKIPVDVKEVLELY